MKIRELQTLAAGTWARDCELIYLLDFRELKINYRRDEDDTYWSLQCNHVVSYKVVSEEFSTFGYLMQIPSDGAFFEILDSPWILEFGRERSDILDQCKHYVLSFYDEIIEIIAREFVFEKIEKEDAKFKSDI